MCGLAVVEAISDSRTSMGMRSSYNVGAWRMIPAVPTTTASVKIHRNSLSSTIATYFQSSLTWNTDKSTRLVIVYWPVGYLLVGNDQCVHL